MGNTLSPAQCAFLGQDDPCSNVFIPYVFYGFTGVIMGQNLVYSFLLGALLCIFELLRAYPDVDFLFLTIMYLLGVVAGIFVVIGTGSKSTVAKAMLTMENYWLAHMMELISSFFAFYNIDEYVVITKFPIGVWASLRFIMLWLGVIYLINWKLMLMFKLDVTSKQYNRTYTIWALLIILLYLFALALTLNTYYKAFFFSSTVVVIAALLVSINGMLQSG